MNDILKQVEQAVIAGNKTETLRLVEQAAGEGYAPEKIIAEGLTAGLYVVGDKFEQGEYFLPDMMLAAEAMNDAIAYLEPLVKSDRVSGPAARRVVIGTVKGDLHSIGKDIVIMMLKAAGFAVFDLGVDVPAERFVEEVRNRQADILGISALMTTTIQEQVKIIKLLEQRGLRKGVKVIVGGAPISAEWAEKIGADAYGTDAIAGVKKAKALLDLA